MENASKALLIAGAILIVILLVAVGVMVYKQSTDPIATAESQIGGMTNAINNVDLSSKINDAFSTLGD